MFTVISADDRSRPVPAGRGAAAGILKQGQTCERPRTFAGVGRGAPSWGRINRLRFLSPPAAQQAPGGPTYSRPSKRARIVDRVSPLSDRRNPGLQPARDRPAGWPSEDDGAGGFSFNRSCRSAQSKPVIVFGSVAEWQTHGEYVVPVTASGRAGSIPAGVSRGEEYPERQSRRNVASPVSGLLAPGRNGQPLYLPPAACAKRGGTVPAEPSETQPVYENCDYQSRQLESVPGAFQPASRPVHGIARLLFPVSSMNPDGRSARLLRSE